NDIHGTAYAFGRSDSFDARNYFNPVGSPKQPLELEQFGGSAGGRLIPDKLFWFGAYERQKYTVGNALPGHIPTSAVVPSSDGVPGDNGCIILTFQNCNISIPNALADLQTAQATIQPLSLYFLGCGMTAPYTPCTGNLYGPNSGQGTFVSLNYPN